MNFTNYKPGTLLQTKVVNEFILLHKKKNRYVTVYNSNSFIAKTTFPKGTTLLLIKYVKFFYKLNNDLVPIVLIGTKLYKPLFANFLLYGVEQIQYLK